MLLYLTLLLPLLGGAVIPLLHFRSVRARTIYMEAVTIATSVLCFVLMANRIDTRYQLITILDGMSISFRTDGMGCVFAGLVSVLWPIATLYASEYMEHEERPDSFFAFYTMTFGITLAVAFAGSLFTMYVFFEFLTIITLPLVTHKQDPASNRAGRMYVSFSITGAALAFIALMVAAFFGKTTDFTLGGIFTAEGAAGHEGLLRWVFLLAFVGFGTKAAVFPMYAWLPSASVAPTPVTALLHAVAVVNTGAFAVLRVIYYTFGTDLLYGSAPQMIAIGLACFTVLFGSVMAVREQHLKRRLAYSTISNLSYMLMGAALMTEGGMVGSLAHLVCHGLMKITLFYCAGAILVKAGREYVQDLRGFHKKMPFVCAAFTVGAVAMVGIPPLCGFVSKWNLLTAAASTGLMMGTIAVCALIISAILTAIYLFTVSFVMYFRPLNAGEYRDDGKLLDPSWRMKLPLAVLCVLIAAVGIWSEPLITLLRNIASGTIF